MACSHAPKPTTLPEILDGPEQLLTEVGQSSQAVYSSDGNRLLFVSADRPGHKQPQVYEKDLVTGHERRITYQNGATMSPRYHPRDPLILYASSTDELKENPTLLYPQPQDQKLPPPYQEPMEVYLHHLSALVIIRVTEHPGFDGEARFSNNGRELVWTHVERQSTTVHALNLPQWDPSSHALPAARVLQELGANATQYVITPNSQFNAWVSWDDSFGVSRLLVRKGTLKPTEINSAHIVQKTDLSFSPDSKWLVWAQRNPELKQAYELWAMDVDTLCPRRIEVKGGGDRRHPSLSPDMKWITYTRIKNGTSRIARLPFTAPTERCSPTRRP